MKIVYYLSKQLKFNHIATQGQIVIATNLPSVLEHRFLIEHFDVKLKINKPASGENSNHKGTTFILCSS